MPAKTDLFHLFRWLLAIVGAVYTILCTGQVIRGWLVYFGGSRETALLGRYTLVLLLRTRTRQFGWELCQISLLVAALAGLIYVHRL